MTLFVDKTIWDEPNEQKQYGVWVGLDKQNRHFTGHNVGISMGVNGSGQTITKEDIETIMHFAGYILHKGREYRENIDGK